MVLTRFLTNPSGAKTPPGFSIAKLPGVAKGHTDVRILFLLWAWRWLRFFKTCTVGIRIYQVCLKMKDEPHRYNVYTVYIMYIYIYTVYYGKMRRNHWILMCEYLQSFQANWCKRKAQTQLGGESWLHSCPTIWGVPTWGRRSHFYHP